MKRLGATVAADGGERDLLAQRTAGHMVGIGGLQVSPKLDDGARAQVQPLAVLTEVALARPRGQQLFGAQFGQLARRPNLAGQIDGGNLVDGIDDAGGRLGRRVCVVGADAGRCDNLLEQQVEIEAFRFGDVGLRSGRRKRVVDGCVCVDDSVDRMADSPHYGRISGVRKHHEGLVLDVTCDRADFLAHRLEASVDLRVGVVELDGGRFAFVLCVALGERFRV